MLTFAEKIKKLFTALVTCIVATLDEMISPEMVGQVKAKILVKFEKWVKGTSNKYDDAAVLPFIALIRKKFNVPDLKTDGVNSGRLAAMDVVKFGDKEWNFLIAFLQFFLNFFGPKKLPQYVPAPKSDKKDHVKWLLSSEAVVGMGPAEWQLLILLVQALLAWLNQNKKAEKLVNKVKQLNIPEDLSNLDYILNLVDGVE